MPPNVVVQCKKNHYLHLAESSTDPCSMCAVNPPLAPLWVCKDPTCQASTGSFLVCANCSGTVTCGRGADISTHQAEEKVKTMLGLKSSDSVEVNPLPSFVGQSFKVQVKRNKIVEDLILRLTPTSGADMEFNRSVIRLLLSANQPLGFDTPSEEHSLDNTTVTSATAGDSYYAQLLRNPAGVPLANLTQEIGEELPQGADLPIWRDVGRAVGRLDRTLSTLDIQLAPVGTPSRWDLAHAMACASLLEKEANYADRALLQGILNNFQHQVLPKLRSLRRSIIHSNINTTNVLIQTQDQSSDADSALPTKKRRKSSDSHTRNITVRPVGITDFDLLTNTCTVFEVVNVAAAALVSGTNPMSAAVQVVGGYSLEHPLTEAEVDVLYPLMLTRLVVCLAQLHLHQLICPNATRLPLERAAILKTLHGMQHIEPASIRTAFRIAAGLDEVCAVPELRQMAEASDSVNAMSDMLAVRKKVLGSNLSLLYRASPLCIVKGSGAYLFGHDGIPYLDCVNNVAHVGHCHPKVVARISAQAAHLNTNSRYLHPSILRYGAALLATLPAPLSSGCVYMVSTGSEANELALRLARNYTNAQDVLVLQDAYHGNTNTLVGISPYGKYGGDAPTTIKVALPDAYRGQYRGPGAGDKYAADFEATLTRLAGEGRRVSAFISESIVGCGGQVVPPTGWRKRCYEAVRAAGAVVIADEVQCGLFRCGPKHPWAFMCDDDGSYPDIVTMGKPLGNGHPVSAVVATAEVASAWNTGAPEFFSTFGGNPVSCEAAAAVLDVIKEERLAENAESTGQLLKDLLTELMPKHRFVGDVRGAGLFLGVEIVQDNVRPAGTPADSYDWPVAAPELAKEVMLRLRHAGIMVSTDGASNNVIKIKPPIVFTPVNARHLVSTLSQVLQSLEAALALCPTAFSADVAKDSHQHLAITSH